jgi:pyridoxal phosphate enzyme (YggS family)
MGIITDNVRRLLSEIPAHVTVVAAVKTRSPGEVAEAIEAGVPVIGENYVQEGETLLDQLGRRATFHFIGHLQRNKVRKAVEIFDLIETLDSLRLAQEIDKRCAVAGKTMDVLIEINSGREPQKFGVFPEESEDLIRRMAALGSIRVTGLMTMGPYTDDADTVRPYFVETRRCFEALKSLSIPNMAMNILSMGMSGSYHTAIEEGATHVRIGTAIFGPR